MRVDYYAGGSLVASAAAAPWTATWANVAPGQYVITATATDNSGLAATSGAVTVSVAALAPAGPAAPAPRPAGEIVIHAAAGNRMTGQWQRVADATAAGGFKVQTADRGVSAPSAPAASPASFVEAAFSAPAGVGYHVWVRLRAGSDSRWNDSVWVQFSDSLTPAGAPVYRAGTTDALLVNLEPCDACGVAGWGWQDKAWYGTRSDVAFASDGLHVVRMQLREDGTQVDQIVLTPASAGAGAPGAGRNDATILPKTVIASGANVVACATDAAPADIHGTWSRTADPTAAAGVALASADRKVSALAAPLVAPASYVDVTFPAVAGVPYRMWVRLRAARDQKANDSAFVQFSDATVDGVAAYDIGTTSGALVSLEACNGCKVSGWGWQGGAWWLTATPPLTFRYDGLHTLRIQAREDGVQFDQVVFSPVIYLAAPPGAARDDGTIVAR